MNFDVKVDVIVNDVFGEELEKTPGAVGAPEFCAIESSVPWPVSWFSSENATTIGNATYLPMQKLEKI